MMPEERAFADALLEFQRALDEACNTGREREAEEAAANLIMRLALAAAAQQ
jgi:hypothetical protein